MAPIENLTISSSDAAPDLMIVEGQIDSHTSPSLDDALAAVAAAGTVSIDLSGVSFVDSSGLKVIVKAHKRQQQAGGTLTIVSPSEPVARLLDITGLTSELRIDR